jgi:AhpC/TSA family
MPGQMAKTRAVMLLLTLGLVAMLPAHAALAPGLAPMFTLEGLGRESVSLAAYKGSPVILLFWAPW